VDQSSIPGNKKIGSAKWKKKTPISKFLKIQNKSNTTFGAKLLRRKPLNNFQKKKMGEMIRTS